MLYSTATILALSAVVLAAPTTLIKRDDDKINYGYWQATCWGTPLNTGETDASHDALKAWAAQLPTPMIVTSDHNEYESFTSGNTMGYACTDDHWGSNYFSDTDIQAAYDAMDKACPRYTSGYAIYVFNKSTFNGWTYDQRTGKIVGKALAGTAVCQGSDGA